MTPITCSAGSQTCTSSLQLPDVSGKCARSIVQVRPRKRPLEGHKKATLDNSNEKFRQSNSPPTPLSDTNRIFLFFETYGQPLRFLASLLILGVICCMWSCESTLSRLLVFSFHSHGSVELPLLLCFSLTAALSLVSVCKQGTSGGSFVSCCGREAAAGEAPLGGLHVFIQRLTYKNQITSPNL